MSDKCGKSGHPSTEAGIAHHRRVLRPHQQRGSEGLGSHVASISRIGDTMELPRRRFLHLAAGAAAVLPLSRFAWAQTYPTRPVRLVVGYAAGGGTDIAVRLIGQWLSERLGRQFIPIDGKRLEKPQRPRSESG
jgi:hypothetical protein